MIHNDHRTARTLEVGIGNRNRRVRPRKYGVLEGIVYLRSIVIRNGVRIAEEGNEEVVGTRILKRSRQTSRFYENDTPATNERFLTGFFRSFRIYGDLLVFRVTANGDIIEGKKFVRFSHGRFVAVEAQKRCVRKVAFIPSIVYAKRIAHGVFGRFERANQGKLGRVKIEVISVEREFLSCGIFTNENFHVVTITGKIF